MNVIPNRIALTGKSGSGKSSLAKAISQTYGHEILSTGGICREISNKLFGDESKENMQRITDALQTIDQSIFLKACLRVMENDKPVIVDAIRFNTDYEAVKEMNFTVIRLQCRDELRISRLSERKQTMLKKDHLHRSETELDSITTDCTIDNSGTLDELYHLFEEFIREINESDST